MVLPAESNALPQVVRTKLHPPQLRADVIKRPHLLRAIHEAALNHRLTLLSAPAGYGKTTLLASLCVAHPDLPIAWLSLDALDNDPTVFLSGLVASVRHCCPGFGHTTSALLASVSDIAGDMPRIVGVLVNDLAAAIEQPIVLVIDDLHVINAAVIHHALDYLLEKLPPDAHLVISTRHDPPIGLPRLRARRQLSELRLTDLRFATKETSQFLEGVRGPHLSTEQVGIAHERTDGWPAALCLLAGALAHLQVEDDRDVLVNHLSANPSVFEYLAEEVMGGEATDVRTFLLEVSILSELSAARCQAITGRPDADALLISLYRRNLFVMALDSGGTIYRFNELFRSYLLHRLTHEYGPERVRPLHLRAAAAEPDPGRAIGHLVAAKAWELAATAIEQAGEEVLERGALDTVRSWIESLPEDVRRRYPRLALLLGVADWNRWELRRAKASLEEARRGFVRVNDPVGEGQASVYLASCLTATGEREEAQSLIERASHLPLPHRSLIQLGLTRAWQSLFSGSWQGANLALDEVLKAVEGSTDGWALRIVQQQFHADFLVLPGGPGRATRLIQMARSRLATQPDPIWAYVESIAAWLQIWRGNWDGAREHAELALAINNRFGGPEQAGLDVVGTSTGQVLARMLAVQGDDIAADSLFDRLEAGLAGDALNAPPGDHWRAAFTFPIARARLTQGRIREAQALVARMATPHPGEWPGASVLRAMMRGHLLVAEERPDQALSFFEEAAKGQARLPFTATYGLTAVPLASVLLGLGQSGRALTVFAPLLEEHEREGTPGAIMLEDPAFVIPLLRLAIAGDACAGFATTIVQRLVEPSPRHTMIADTTPGAMLTSRELEVVRLLALGHSNQEIADRLYVSIHTVKRHVANLLVKLGARSRTEAVAKARDFGLV